MTVLKGKHDGFTLSIANRTGFVMTISQEELSAGKWVTQPQTQIESGRDAQVEMSGKSGRWEGTKGSITYQINDAGLTSVTWKFYAPFAKQGYFSATIFGKLAGNYVVKGTQFNPKKRWHNLTSTVSRAPQRDSQAQGASGD